MQFLVLDTPLPTTQFELTCSSESQGEPAGLLLACHAARIKRRVGMKQGIAGDGARGDDVYVAPAFEVIGDIEALTAGAEGPGHDSDGSASLNPS